MTGHPLAGQPWSRCRWCRAETAIVWCVTANAKQIPIELAPNPAGNVEIEWVGTANPPLAVVHAGPPGMFDDWTAYMPHHATCARDKEPTR